MTAIDPFLTMMSFLQMTIAQVAPELLGTPDIHEALTKLKAHESDLTLPGLIKKLHTGMLQATGRLARSAEKAEEARRAVARIEAQIGKINENIERWSKRPEHSDLLKQEIAGLEATLVEPRALLKKAESLRKGDETRLRNLTQQLDVATQRSEISQLRHLEMSKLAKKTSDHLKNRQAHRDRKAAKREEKAAKPILASPEQGRRSASDPSPGHIVGRRR